MKTHQLIDQRSLAMARRIVERIDADPTRAGLARARRTCRRWAAQRRTQRRTGAVAEWENILKQPWSKIRLLLLDPSEEGCRRRQNSPFCGVLSPRERWQLYREFRGYAAE